MWQILPGAIRHMADVSHGRAINDGQDVVSIGLAAVRKDVEFA
jgi:hypothetical protein